MNDAPTPPKETHPDPLTGEPGAHLVGTSLGAAIAGAATTAIGLAAGGPVGGLVGAAVGSMLGGLAGKELAEVIELTAEPSMSTPIVEVQEPEPTTTVGIAAARPADTEPVEKRAAEIARRDGRPRIADSDRRRAFQELKDEEVPPPPSMA